MTTPKNGSEENSMHYLVRFIVEADYAHQATSKVIDTLDNLVEMHEFDWYHDTAEQSRWKDCWKPIRLDIKKGQDMVQNAMNSQLAEFKRALATIRLMLDGYTDEQIFDEEFKQVDGLFLSRFQFSLASGYYANASQLYNEDGDAITNRAELSKYLKDTSKLWVIQVDCHN